MGPIKQKAEKRLQPTRDGACHRPTLLRRGHHPSAPPQQGELAASMTVYPQRCPSVNESCKHGSGAGQVKQVA